MERLPPIKRKRILFVITSQSLICAGGIGQFAQGFVNLMTEMGYIVDLATDKKPNAWGANLKWARTFYPENPYAYDMHTRTFAFTDSINFEKEANLRTAVLKAWNTCLYDLVLCNTPECLSAAYSLGLSKWVQTMYYTHNENLVNINGTDFDGIGPYSEAYTNYYGKMLHVPDITIGTQTHFNVKQMSYFSGIPNKERITHVRMPMPNALLLEPTEIDHVTTDLLWVGRWEERKNPKALLKYLQYAMTQKHVPSIHILSNESGAGKFIEALEKIKYPKKKWDVRGGEDGHFKADFIRSCRVCLNTSMKESFGYSVLEAMGHCFMILPEQYNWSQMWKLPEYEMFNFVDTNNVELVHKAVLGGLLLHGKNGSNLSHVWKYQEESRENWRMVILRKMPGEVKVRDSKQIGVMDKNWVEDYVHGLARAGNIASVEDIETMVKNRRAGNIHALQYEQGTWLTTDPAKSPKTVKERATIDSVFA